MKTHFLKNLSEFHDSESYQNDKYPKITLSCICDFDSTYPASLEFHCLGICHILNISSRPRKSGLEFILSQVFQCLVEVCITEFDRVLRERFHITLWTPPLMLLSLQLGQPLLLFFLPPQQVLRCHNATIASRMGGLKKWISYPRPIS